MTGDQLALAVERALALAPRHRAYMDIRAALARYRRANGEALVWEGGAAEGHGGTTYHLQPVPGSGLCGLLACVGGDGQRTEQLGPAITEAGAKELALEHHRLAKAAASD